jgi:hypothetical protein
VKQVVPLDPGHERILNRNETRRTERGLNVEEGERVRHGRLLRRDARGSSERVEKQRAGDVTSVRRWCWWCRRRWQEVTAVEEEDGEERRTASATSLCDERPSSAFLPPPHRCTEQCHRARAAATQLSALRRDRSRSGSICRRHVST